MSGRVSGSYQATNEAMELMSGLFMPSDMLMLDSGMMKNTSKVQNTWLAAILIWKNMCEKGRLQAKEDCSSNLY